VSRRDIGPEEIPVVILAGGLGTRLREATESVPKPLVEIGEKPIVWHIMKLYGHYGLRRFVLCLGYKSYQFKDYFLRYREHLSDVTVEIGNGHRTTFHNQPAEENWEVTMAETGLLTGTGGRLHRVGPYLEADVFMLTYGDGIGAVDVGALLDFHRSHGKIGTVTGVHPSGRYGEMRTEGEVVAEFDEKPTHSEGFVSGGFFVFQREFLDYLDPEDPAGFFEKGPLQRLAREGELAMFPHEGFWMGMDTFREYTELNKLWAQGQAPWRVWEED
jgi:glucose-1-phosphate cytidylyltransferase